MSRYLCISAQAVCDLPGSRPSPAREAEGGGWGCAGCWQEQGGDWTDFPFPSTDMESVNPNFVTVAPSTTDVLETECNVTEGTWGKDLGQLTTPRA